MMDQWTSISAFTEAKGRDGRTGCLRRWAFKRFFKLPTAPVKATAFGDVFHAVLQRFYSADDRGLVNGLPVNLYPDGWKVVPDRFGRKDDVLLTRPDISHLEEMCIKNLVDKAINEGVLVRTPGRMVEQAFPDTTILTDLRTGAKQVLKGFIDLETPASVEDHKTVKSKKWALSMKALETDAQMLTYAKIKYLKGHSGNVWLIHNNFIKDQDQPEVIRREIIVEPGYVEDYYQRVLLPGFREMFNVYLTYQKTDIGRWREIAGPIDTQKECNHYYGGKCPFSGICSGSCDIPTYFNIFKELNEQLAAEKSSNLLPKEIPINNPQTKGNLMNLIDRIKAGNQAALATPPAVAPVVTPAAPVAAPPTPSAALSSVLAAVKAKAQQAPAQVAPAPDPAPTPAAPAAPTVAPLGTAPWYQPGCQACTTNAYQGFNSKGTPCNICDNMASLAGKPTSAMFTFSCDAAGKLTCTPKEGTPATPVTPQTPAVSTQVTATAPVIPATPAPEKRTRRTKAEIDAEKAAKEQAPSPEVAQDAEAQVKTGTPGFTLLIGVTYAKGFPSNVVSADDLVGAAMEHLASVGKMDITTTDHHAVMRGLDIYMPTLITALVEANAIVVSVKPTPYTALDRVVGNLRPYAKEVLVGMAG